MLESNTEIKEGILQNDTKQYRLEYFLDNGK
jgi:hypothetical protein